MHFLLTLVTPCYIISHLIDVGQKVAKMRVHQNCTGVICLVFFFSFQLSLTKDYLTEDLTVWL
jgi:hypothetical protein